jgi:hypothetical protein
VVMVMTPQPSTERYVNCQIRERRSEKKCVSKDRGPLATPVTGPRFCSNQTVGGASSQMPIVPQDSPLNNVIHSATLHEQIIQARIKYNIAQKQLLDEKAIRGVPSKAILARVRFLSQTLASLHEKRNEVSNDTDRMDSFRRSDLRDNQRDVKDLTTPESPPGSAKDSEWRNRLTLCYEAVDSTKSSRGHIHAMERESITLPEGRSMVKQKHSDENRLLSIDKTGERVPTRAQQRQVRFALTDVETCL